MWPSLRLGWKDEYTPSDHERRTARAVTQAPTHTCLTQRRRAAKTQRGEQKETKETKNRCVERRRAILAHTIRILLSGSAAKARQAWTSSVARQGKSST